MKRGTGVLLVGVFAVALSAGCASRENCPACREDSGPAESPNCLDAVNASGAQLLADPLNLLFLSGGGARGAWGAGFLNGWSESGKRPKEFQVVTGISTGALQATFAFLGEHYDNVLYESYTQIDDSDIFRNRFPFISILALLWAPSPRTTGPLKALIKDRIPDGLIEKVAAEAGRRLLCVGTVNLDTGRFVAWDMTKLAHGRQYEKYRSIVAASAAVPVLFPPEMIDGAPHVDGGTREQVFARTIIERISRKRSARASGSPQVKGSAYFLINGQLAVTPECIQQHGIDIAKRSLSLLMSEAIYGSLYRSSSLLPSESWEFSVQYIPDAFNVGLDSMRFDRQAMCRLYHAGFEVGRSGKWVHKIPDVGTAPGDCPSLREEPPPIPECE